MSEKDERRRGTGKYCNRKKRNEKRGSERTLRGSEFRKKL